MGKQGIHKWERSMQQIITFYKMNNKWFFRAYSSLTGERVKTSKEFIKSMICAHCLGVASKLASVVYQLLPERWREFQLFRKLVGIAIKCLNGKPEMTLEEILAALEQQLYNWGIPQTPAV